MSTVARKQSTRSSKDEDTFVVDDKEAPSLGDEKIGRHEEWSSVIETLYKLGWLEMEERTWIDKLCVFKASYRYNQG